MLTLARTIALATLLLVSTGAHSESYPDHPVKIVVPYPPGGGTDAFARFLAEQLSLKSAHRFLVENLAGANGGIGTAFVAAAKPDGHTLLIASPGTLLVNPQIYKGARYRLSSFEPVIALSNFTNLVVVSPKLASTMPRSLSHWQGNNPENSTSDRRATGISAISPAKCSRPTRASTSCTFRTRAGTKP